MSYVHPDYPSKAALKRAIADGTRVTVYATGLERIPLTGTVSLEGPHSPKPHSWYGVGKMENGRLVSVS